jgi:hypothetical protein
MKLREKPSGENIVLIPLYAFGLVVVVTVVVFGITCLVTEHDGGAHRAWEVLTGTRTPVGQAIGLELALSVLGYAFLPVVIGLIVTDSVLRFTRRHTIPTAIAVTNIGEDAKKSAKAANEAAVRAEDAALRAQAAAPAATAPPSSPIQPSGS